MIVKVGRTQRSNLLVISISIILISMTFITFILGKTNEGAPIEREFQVNAYTTATQRYPSVTIATNGSFMIAWDSWQDGSWDGVYAQRYDSKGNELIPPPSALKGTEMGNETQVNTYTTDRQWHPSAAMDSNGNYVIVWESLGQDGSGYGVYAQHYDNNGNPVGTEFKVNSYIANDQWGPSVSMNSTGNYVVTWHSEGQDGSNYGIFAQRYNATGNPLGTEFQVNTYTTSSQSNPSVAMNSTGYFVIAWNGEGASDSMGIYAQRYDNNGNPLGTEFRVNTYLPSVVWEPSIAMNSTGHFVIAWHSGGQDGSNDGVYAQRYHNNGSAQGPEFRVNTYTTGFQNEATVAMNSTGYFVIVWQSEQDGSGYGIFAKHYDNNGNPIGPEFQVNTYISSNQVHPSIAMNSTGHFVIAWESNGQDGDSVGVFAQRYDNITDLIISDIQAQAITNTTATLTWKNNWPANSTVRYGLSRAYGSSIQSNSKVTLHSIDLTGLEPGRLYHLRIASYRNSTTYKISEDFTFTTKFPIDLNPGWNMISVPLNQTDPDFGKVLENISGDYDTVQWFAITDLVYPWKHNHINKPSHLNDLKEINRFMGTWIHITNSSSITYYVDGTAPDIGYVNQIILRNGWNLVGYPSLIERPPDSSGLPAEVDMVKWYNASSGLWENWDPGGSPDTLNLLKPGQGLWIHYTGVTDVWSLEYVS